MALFSTIVSVAAATYPTAPQVVFPFSPDWTVVRVKTAAGLVHVSVTGSNAGSGDELELEEAKPNEQVQVIDPARKLFLRLDAVGPAIDVLVQAQTDDP